MAHFNGGDKPFDFERGFVIDFDPQTGLSKTLDTGKRYLSQMKGMFADEKAYEEALAKEDSVVYEFHSMPAPETPGDFAFGCSILNPGKVGDEYYFTKGHFHTILDPGLPAGYDQSAQRMSLRAPLSLCEKHLCGGASGIYRGGREPSLPVLPALSGRTGRRE